MIIIDIIHVVDSKVANRVLVQNTSTIVSKLSEPAIFLQFARELWSLEAIAETTYKHSVDELTRQPTTERVQYLLHTITSSVKDNAKLFNKLLISLQKCQKQDLAHELITHYEGMYSLNFQYLHVPLLDNVCMCMHVQWSKCQSSEMSIIRMGLRQSCDHTCVVVHRCALC